MSVVTKEPYLRFEAKQNGVLTVLEGEELERLIKRFYWHHSREIKKHKEPMNAFLLSLARAYQVLYSKDVVRQDDLRDLSTPDARKIDLFYKGMYLLLCEALYPDEDWEKKWLGKGSFMEFVNQVIQLKPNFFGIGVDINAVLRRYLPRRK